MGIELLLRSPAHALAVIEAVTPWVNGPDARKLASVLDALAYDPEGSLLDERDRKWLADTLSIVDLTRRVDHWAAELDRLAETGVRVVLSSSPEYPSNLQLIHDRPPVLFYRGDLTESDRRSVAIVGTRNASPAGMSVANRIARELAEAGIVVVSGLANGIDTAAHTAAVNARRRTIAVFGTPIDRIYPAKNRGLASAIVDRGGALISQFLPGRETGPWAFPVRNITMSGLALGTVVVEAGETSGARIQAEAAVAHGKRLLLLDQLVTHREWARDMAELPGVRVVASADEVIAAVDQFVAAAEPALL